MEKNKTAAEAFSKQSVHFDETYRSSIIVNYMRKRVRDTLLKNLKPNSHILELNAGTGEDAVWMAQQGHRVLATDASTGMLEKLTSKVAGLKLEERIKSQELSYLNLQELNGQQFDFIFSNFGGLNCTDKLDQVLYDVIPLIKPGGSICLVVMPPFCFWETLHAIKGNFKLAFRRWSKNGTQAHIDGLYFKTYYYFPSYILKYLKGLKHVSTEALCVSVPPDYLKHHMEKWPSTFRFLKWCESLIKSIPVLRACGDYYIIVAKTKE